MPQEWYKIKYKIMGILMVISWDFSMTWFHQAWWQLMGISWDDDGKTLKKSGGLVCVGKSPQFLKMFMA